MTRVSSANLSSCRESGSARACPGHRICSTRISHNCGRARNRLGPGGWTRNAAWVHLPSEHSRTRKGRSSQMGFDLRRFLKRTPADSLKPYFVSRCEAAVADVDWSEPQARLMVKLIGLLEQLDTAQSAEIWAEFERIAQFDDESGRKALRSVISDEHVLAAFDRLEGNNACGIHILLADPDSFERALAVHYATRLRNGRDWSGLEVLGGSSVALTEGDQALDAFASRLSEAFHAEGGGRRRLKVESFARRDQDPAGGAAPRPCPVHNIRRRAARDRNGFRERRRGCQTHHLSGRRSRNCFRRNRAHARCREQGWKGTAARHSTSFRRHDDQKRCGDLDTRSEGIAAGKAQDTPHLQSPSRGPGAPS